MNYPKQAIEKLTKLIGGEVSALNWLADNGYKDLVIAGSGICGNETAVASLKKENKPVLAAFVETVNGDKNAFKWLTNNKHYTWAATANAALKDKEAMKWLIKFKLEHFADLSKSISKQQKKNEDEETSLFYKMPQ